MAPRKKATAAAVIAPEDIEGPGIENYYLPRSLLTRVAKRALPDGTTLAQQVPTALQNGSTVFISYLTMLAHDIATEKGQKTVTATHVLEAVKQLGWDDQAAVSKKLRSELSAFRKIAEAKKNGTALPAPAPKKKAAAVPSASKTSAAAAPAVAAPSVTNNNDVAGPSDANPSGAADEDSSMTVLADGRPNADADADEEMAYADEVEDQEVYDAENDDDEEPVEEEEEEEEPLAEDEEDRVGDGLEPDELADDGE